MSSSTVSVVNSFKVLILGDAGIGKTVLINRHRTGEFINKYFATLGVEVTPLFFNTEQGVVRLNMWDFAGNEEYGGLREAYYKGADACILMFDLTGKDTYKKIPNLYNSVRATCGNIPIVLCGNKVDCKDRKLQPRDITFHRIKNLYYYDISAKSNYNFEKPFLYLLRKLLKNEDLKFFETVDQTKSEKDEKVTNNENKEEELQDNDKEDKLEAEVENLLYSLNKLQTETVDKNIKLWAEKTYKELLKIVKI
jgi:GTP-binding nuclear protein Ran